MSSISYSKKRKMAQSSNATSSQSPHITSTQRSLLLQDLPPFLQYVKKFTAAINSILPTVDKRTRSNIVAAWNFLAPKEKSRYQELAAKSESKLLCPPGWTNLSKTKQHDLQILAWLTPTSDPSVQLIESKKELLAWFNEKETTAKNTKQQPAITKPAITKPATRANKVTKLVKVTANVTAKPTKTTKKRFLTTKTKCQCIYSKPGIKMKNKLTMMAIANIQPGL